MTAIRVEPVLTPGFLALRISSSYICIFLLDCRIYKKSPGTVPGLIRTCFHLFVLQEFVHSEYHGGAFGTGGVLAWGNGSCAPTGYYPLVYGSDDSG